MAALGEGYLAYFMQGAAAQSVTAANTTTTGAGKKGGKVSRYFTTRR
jgi:hypothetical protein